MHVLTLPFALRLLPSIEGNRPRTGACVEKAFEPEPHGDLNG